MERSRVTSSHVRLFNVLEAPQDGIERKKDVNVGNGRSGKSD